MELMVLRSRPAAMGLLRPKVHRLPSTSTSSCSDSLSFPTTKSASSPVDTNRRIFQCHAVPSSSIKASATGSVATASGISEQKGASKEKDVAFVAGSTGRVGSRLVRELLKLGFRVRAGVRSSQRAGALVQSVRQMKPVDSTQAPRKIQVLILYNFVSGLAEERLEIVECDLENPSTIQSAVANASIVICCIGASEKEVFDITGPYRIDYKATSNLIQEATKLKVDHFILLTSLGTGAIGFPASLLNLFWGVLCWKQKAEEELISSGLPYTIVRPGGMERPTDSFKETHNLVLAKEDTYFGGLVSNLQVAELMACMAKNRSLSCCKVVEVIAETTAPLLPMEQLLSTIPSQRPCPPEPEPELEPEPEPEPEPKPTPEPEPAPEPEPEPDPVQMSKPRPQSPYASYEDLKPPSSPTPSQPIAKSKSELSSINKEEPTLPIVFKPESVQVSKPRPLSPYTAYEDLKPPSTPTPPQPNTEPKSTASSSEDTQVSVTSTVPLSPTSPQPKTEPKSTASSSEDTQVSVTSTVPLSLYPSEIKSVQEDILFVFEPESVQVSKSRPLSPYTAYEDLKPPSTPTPPQPKTEPKSATSSSIDTQVSVGGTASLSPYPSYEDLKPPSVPDNGAPISISASAPSAEEIEPAKPYPLSPYTMYEDLKPPTSPVPSVPKY